MEHLVKDNGSARICLRVDSRLLDDIDRRADTAGLTRSEFCRAVLSSPVGVEDGVVMLGDGGTPPSSRAIASIVAALDQGDTLLLRSERDLAQLVRSHLSSENPDGEQARQVGELLADATEAWSEASESLRRVREGVEELLARLPEPS